MAKPIEVKAAKVIGNAVRFFLSEQELRKSRELPNHTFALVYNGENHGIVIWQFAGSDFANQSLRAVNYEAILPKPL